MSLRKSIYPASVLFQGIKRGERVQKDKTTTTPTTTTSTLAAGWLTGGILDNCVSRAKISPSQRNTRAAFQICPLFRSAIPTPRRDGNRAHVRMTFLAHSPAGSRKAQIPSFIVFERAPARIRTSTCITLVSRHLSTPGIPVKPPYRREMEELRR